MPLAIAKPPTAWPDEPYSVSGCIGAKCAEPSSWEGYDVEQATGMAFEKGSDEICQSDLVGGLVAIFYFPIYWE